MCDFGNGYGLPAIYVSYPLGNVLLLARWLLSGGPDLFDG